MIENKDQLMLLIKEVLTERSRQKNKIQKNKSTKNKLQKNKIRKPKKIREEDEEDEEI